MSITSRFPRSLAVSVISGVFLAMSVSGCVSSGTYELAQKEAQDLKRELQQERGKREAIEKTYGERIKQMENLATRLNISAERYDNITKSWSDLRNELTALRVNREMERQKGICGVGLVLEGDPASTTPTK